METADFEPIPTCDIPMPVVEASESDARRALPRILLQAAGIRTASRRILMLALLFLLMAGGELALLVHLPSPEPLVIYRDLPARTLMEPAP